MLVDLVDFNLQKTGQNYLIKIAKQLLCEMLRKFSFDVLSVLSLLLRHLYALLTLLNNFT
jgi:hypothetical protein